MIIDFMSYVQNISRPDHSKEILTCSGPPPPPITTKTTTPAPCHPQQQQHLLQATLKPVPSVEGGPTTTPNPRTHTLFFRSKCFKSTGTHPPCYSCCKSGHCMFLHCVGRIVKRNWSGMPNRNWMILDSHKISVKLQRKNLVALSSS